MWKKKKKVMCSGPSASVGEWIQDPPSDTTLEGGSSSFRSASMEQRINCILFLFCTVIAEWQLKWLNMCFYIMYLGGSYKSNKLNVIVVIPHKTKVSRGFGGCLLTLLRFSGVPTVTASQAKCLDYNHNARHVTLNRRGNLTAEIL